MNDLKLVLRPTSLIAPEWLISVDCYLDPKSALRIRIDIEVQEGSSTLMPVKIFKTRNLTIDVLKDSFVIKNPTDQPVVANVKLKMVGRGEARTQVTSRIGLLDLVLGVFSRTYPYIRVKARFKITAKSISGTPDVSVTAFIEFPSDMTPYWAGRENIVATFAVESGGKLKKLLFSTVRASGKGETVLRFAFTYRYRPLKAFSIAILPLTYIITVNMGLQALRSLFYTMHVKPLDTVDMIARITVLLLMARTTRAFTRLPHGMTTISMLFLEQLMAISFVSIASIYLALPTIYPLSQLGLAFFTMLLDIGLTLLVRMAAILVGFHAIATVLYSVDPEYISKMPYLMTTGFIVSFILAALSVALPMALGS